MDQAIRALPSLKMHHGQMHFFYGPGKAINVLLTAVKVFLLKMKSMHNLPVFLQPSAQIVGRVVKTVIGDNYRVAYLVINPGDGALKLINNKDFEMTPNAIVINHIDCMKSYSHGEELSVYQLKTGDVVFDHQGKELGIVSDFVIDITKKKVQGVEISSGAIQDILQGRQEIDLGKIHWASEKSAVADEGSDLT